MKVLFLSAALFLSVPPVLGQSDVQRSHIEANVPSPQEFGEFLSRDLLKYFRDTAATSTADSVEYELLRNEPTQSGVAFPKYYAWVRAKRGSLVLVEGAVRVAAINQSLFEVTHFVASNAATDSSALSRVFPQALVPRIVAFAERTRG